ncbi:MFS transporter [Amycolatopsis sp. NPDC051071]|uniref:MFS transporter n=1 Tax=Amycolatopsis sp. NPDC051071 TaxID=3154637 RepID=UPI00341ED9BC
MTYELVGAKESGSWRELLSGRYAAVSAVLAGGVLVEASNVYLTTSLLPTIVADIGGAEFYAWTMTSFLVASVITSMLVSRLLTTRGGVTSYVLAFVLFAAGTVICAVSPGMTTLLVGRAVQGLGGGLLAGLGYALIQRALPERLWVRAAALVSAMWGVGNILGPAVGGLFGQFGAWRLAFVVLAAVAIALVVLAVRAIPRTETGPSKSAFPLGSLVLLTASVAAVSVASVVSGIATVLAIAVGVVLVVWFVVYERSATASVLPKVVFGRGLPLRWVYLTVVALAFGIGTESFIPLFGQEIGALSPLVAGFLGSALSLGWSLAQILSATAKTPRSVRMLVTAGPLALAAGLVGYGALQHTMPTGVVVAAWFAVLLVAGSGIGMAFPHLTVAALGATDDEEEAAKAAAGINTVLLIATAFSAATAGVLVNLGAPDTVASAHLLVFGFAVAAVLGVFPAMASVRTGPARDGGS